MPNSVFRPPQELETTLFGSVPSSAELTEINQVLDDLKLGETIEDSKTFEFTHINVDGDNEVKAENNMNDLNTINHLYNHSSGVVKDAAVIDMGEEKLSEVWEEIQF